MLTVELSRDSDLPLQGVDLWVDGDSAAVSHPDGLDHPLLQSLRHILLRHMEDAQVRKTTRNRAVSAVRGDYAAWTECVSLQV